MAREIARKNGFSGYSGVSFIQIERALDERQLLESWAREVCTSLGLRTEPRPQSEFVKAEQAAR